MFARHRAKNGTVMVSESLANSRDSHWRGMILSRESTAGADSWRRALAALSSGESPSRLSKRLVSLKRLFPHG